MSTNQNVTAEVIEKILSLLPGADCGGGCGAGDAAPVSRDGGRNGTVFQ